MKVFLSLVLILAGTVSFAAEEKTERKVARTYTQQDIAQKYLDMADMAADVSTNQVCEFELYQSTVIDYFRKARDYDPGLKPTSAIVRAIGSTLDYKVMQMGGWDTFAKLSKGTPKEIVGAQFVSKSAGVYGPQERILLQADGKLEHTGLSYDADKDEFKTTKQVGKWSLKPVGNDRKYPTISLTLKMVSGKPKTRAFAVVPDRPGIYLVPLNKVKKDYYTDGMMGATFSSYEDGCED